MSRENVEVVRRWIQAWNVGDLDTFSAMMAPDVEWLDRPEFPDASSHQGREAVMRHVRDIRQTLDVGFVVQEEVDAGEWTVVRIGVAAKGAASRVSVTAEFFGVVKVVEGQIARRESYSTREEALEAVGLRE